MQAGSLRYVAGLGAPVIEARKRSRALKEGKGAARLRPYEYETRNQHVSGGARGTGAKKGGPENRAALGEC